MECVSTIQDLWHIGTVIGLPGFKNHKHTNEEMELMKRELTKAKREDKKRLAEHESESRGALHRMFSGQKDEDALSAVQNAVDQSYRQVNAVWMKVVRDKYKGSVIRRTVNSLDYVSNPISGLEPYKEHVCMLELFKHEYDALETLSLNALNDNKFARRVSSEVSAVMHLWGQSITANL